MLRLGLAIAAAVFAVDRISKALLLDVMREHGPVVEIAPFFNLVMVWNRGVSFGMFQSGETGRWLLSALAVAIVIGLVVWLRQVEVWWLGVGLGGMRGAPGGAKRFSAYVCTSSGVISRPRSSIPCR